MTTETTRLPDWKTTPGYRVLLAVGWAGICLALFFAAVGVVFGSGGAWWVVAGLAVVVILAVLLLPEPVPHDMLIESHKRLDPH